MEVARTTDGAGLQRGLLASLEAFRAIRRTMPLQHVFAFLLVAMEEGLSVGDYAKKAGVSVAVMSRHLQDIGERNRQKGKGFDLVYARLNPRELRKKEIFLTPKGYALVHQISRQLQR